MTITYLKSGKPAAERADDDAKVRVIVESTLMDIETRGDAGTREGHRRVCRAPEALEQGGGQFVLVPVPVDVDLSPFRYPSTRQSMIKGLLAGIGVG